LFDKKELCQDCIHYDYVINQKNVLLVAKSHQKRMVEFFMKLLEQEDMKCNIIADGKVIQIGWCLYKIIYRNDRFQIFVCDLKNNPLTNITDDLTYALSLFERQMNIVKKIKNVEVVETSYNHTLTISQKALSQNKIYMERQEPIGNGRDSGWYIGSFDDEVSSNPNDYLCIYTYQLIDICEKAIDLLQLPIGILAIIEGHTIIDVVDKNNQKLL